MRSGAAGLEAWRAGPTAGGVFCAGTPRVALEATSAASLPRDAVGKPGDSILTRSLGLRSLPGGHVLCYLCAEKFGRRCDLASAPVARMRPCREQSDGERISGPSDYA